IPAFLKRSSTLRRALCCWARPSAGLMNPNNRKTAAIIREETLRCLCIDHPPNHLDPRRRRSGGTQGTRKPACVQIHLCVDSSRGIGYALALSGSHITETWRHHPQADHLFHLRPRSEEHTSELQSRFDLVCRLLLE